MNHPTDLRRESMAKGCSVIGPQHTRYGHRPSTEVPTTVPACLGRKRRLTRTLGKTVGTTAILPAVLNSHVEVYSQYSTFLRQ